MMLTIVVIDVVVVAAAATVDAVHELREKLEMRLFVVVESSRTKASREDSFVCTYMDIRDAGSSFASSSAVHKGNRNSQNGEALRSQCDMFSLLKTELRVVFPTDPATCAGVCML